MIKTEEKKHLAHKIQYHKARIAELKRKIFQLSYREYAEKLLSLEEEIERHQEQVDGLMREVS
ncbi:MAG: hypothetical protein SFU98_07340 [Leptospiraceae bacterium]|nr:hypothetical protein [Leptospiraceae bacterium]